MKKSAYWILPVLGMMSVVHAAVHNFNGDPGDSGSGDPGNPGNPSTPSGYSIGDPYPDTNTQIGTVFFVTAHGQHGIIAAMDDASIVNGVYSGLSWSAAQYVCTQKTPGAWVLPDKAISTIMFAHRWAINTGANKNNGNGGFAGNRANDIGFPAYWTSTAYDAQNAWDQHFANSNQNVGDVGFQISARCVQVF